MSHVQKPVVHFQQGIGNKDLAQAKPWCKQRVSCRVSIPLAPPERQDLLAMALYVRVCIYIIMYVYIYNYVCIYIYIHMTS